MSHAFFWGAMWAPEAVGVIWPGLWRFDELVDLPPLPWPAVRWFVGVPLLLAGTLLGAASIRALKALGAGLMAFKLTQKTVEGAVYEWTRNPMSLGLYLQFIGISLVVGSSYLLLTTALLYIPAHAFNLWFFEERELSARHGADYDEYRMRVPFLIPSMRQRGIGSAQ